jgi:hypothetical protein
MRAATATAKASSEAVRPAEFQAALHKALEIARDDERIGPLLAATRMRMRFEFTDCGLALNVVATGGEEGRVEWSFGDDPAHPAKLELLMDSGIANRYLQGSESLAIAIARGQARFRGDSRMALFYLPATKLLCEPYRRVVEAEHPDLVIS